MKAPKLNHPKPFTNHQVQLKKNNQNSLFNNPAQLEEMPEEEEMQMKQNPAQLEEEEEEMQMKQNPAQLEEEEEEMQMKQNPAQLEEEEELQMKNDNTSSQSQQNQVTETSQTLPSNVKDQMEGNLQADFSSVKIKESEKATQAGALAYTQGNEITFAPGKFQPHNQDGQELLGHELTHVLQQRSMNVPTTKQQKGLSINDDPALENQADQMGKLAAQKKKEK